MRITINRQQLSVGLIVLIGIILLTACGATDTTPPPTRLSALDIERLNIEANSTANAQSTLVVAQLTQTFAPSPLPTVTLVPQRPTLPPNATLVVLTQEPTVVVELNEDDILGNIVTEQDWLAQPFTATDGNSYTIQSFEGSVIMVQLMSQSCDTCLDQLLNTREIAQKFIDEERGYNIVYVILNTDISTSITGLLNWSSSQGIEPSTDLNWYMGNASPDLLDAIAGTFGDTYIDPQSTPVLIVDMDGFSHIADSGVMTVSRIRDVLIYYADPPQQEEGAIGD